MPRKSKNKKRKSRKNPAKDAKVNDKNEIAQQCPEEDSSIPAESCDFEITHEALERETHAKFFDSGSSFEMDNLPSPPKDYKMCSPVSFHEKSKSVEEIENPKWVELPMRSESVTPTIRPNWNDWSIRTESAFAPERSKSAEETVTLRLLSEPPLRKVSSLPILSSELTEGAKEILYTQLTVKRRDYFILLTDMAGDLSDLMEYFEMQRKIVDPKVVHVNNRWKQRDSSDWFELHRFWEKTVDDLREFMSFFCCTYNDFDDYAEISITIYEFQAMIDQVKRLHEGIALLLQKCTNCYPKYSRFCKSVNESLYLKNVTEYRRVIKNFNQRLKIEWDKFQAVKDSVEYS